MKRVYGIYENSGKARQAVEILIEQGYSRDQIKVVSHDHWRDGGTNYEGYTEDDRSLWEKIKDAFTFDTYHEEYWDSDLPEEDRNLLESYQTNLNRGEIVVLVDDPAYQEPLNNLNFENEAVDEENLESIQLRKEKLKVDKDKFQTGEVTIKKVVETDTQEIEVPIEREEIVIERKPVNKPTQEHIQDSTFAERDEIHIPIMEERARITKDTIVDDEILISKRKVKDTESFVEDLKTEKVEIDEDGENKNLLNNDKN